jgi:hypothetical protein
VTRTRQQSETESSCEATEVNYEAIAKRLESERNKIAQRLRKDCRATA